MPCVTYLSELSVQEMIHDIKTHHPVIHKILSEVNTFTNQEWVCGRQLRVVSMPLFRKPKEEWRFSLYIDCHGEWQVFNFAEGMSVPENTILAFLLGYRNGLAEAQGKIAKEIV